MTAGLKEQEKSIRDQARDWLKKGTVRCVIGYERGPNAERSRPFFAFKPEEADRFVLDETCFQNLTRFLLEELNRSPQKGSEADNRPIGMVLKEHDSKTLVELIKENMVAPEQVKTIEVAVETKPEDGQSALSIEDLEAMNTKDRWAFWKRHLSRCVRCYACREACPLCYCKECVFDQTKPFRWNEPSVRLRENLFFHLVRAMHLAGRCIDCGECERSCPMGIPIQLLNRFLAKRAKERFGVKAGESVEDKTMFGSYDLNDPGEEIW